MMRGSVVRRHGRAFAAAAVAITSAVGLVLYAAPAGAVEPAAELSAAFVPISGPLVSAVPGSVFGEIDNSGDLDAEDLVANLAVPSGWGIAVPSDPLPPGVACSIVATPHAMRCTRVALTPNDSWIVGALVTPPAGTGSGTLTLSASTVTPELGTLPNVATATIAYAPPPVVTVAPDHDLADGDVVQLHGTAFTPNGTVVYCEGIVTAQPSQSDCGVAFSFASSDANGAFSIPVTVRRFLQVGGVYVDCAQPQAACGIGAQDFGSGRAPVVAPISLTPQPPLDTRIEGTVTGAAGVPAPGVIVSAYRSTDVWLPSLQTVTDASGNYVLDDAVLGTAYRIRFAGAAGSGLVTEWYDGATVRTNAAFVSTSPTQPIVDADATLAAGGSLTGTVSGPGGAPVANALVHVYRTGDKWIGTYQTVTASDGSYRIVAIATGTELRIRFAPLAGSGLASEWFNDSPKRGGATPVTVAAGATAVANAQLAAAP